MQAKKSENHLEASTRMYAVFDCKDCFYSSKLSRSKQVSKLVFYAQSRHYGYSQGDLVVVAAAVGEVVIAV